MHREPETAEKESHCEAAAKHARRNGHCEGASGDRGNLFQPSCGSIHQIAASFHSFLVPLLAMTVVAASVHAAGQAVYSINSPDGRVLVTLNVNDGVPKYDVTWRGKPIIRQSALGINFKDQPALAAGLTATASATRSEDNTWQPVWGACSEIRDQFNELTVTLKEKEGLQRAFDLIFRIYNDGLGFRYVLPEQPNLKEYTITGEKTQFYIAGDPTAWALAQAWGITMDGPAPLSEIAGPPKKQKKPAAFKGRTTPLTMKMADDCYITLHEAALDRYASLYVAMKNPHKEGVLLNSVLASPVTEAAPHATPWRAVILAERPGGLVESSLILNLNEPCALEDTSWIKPGTSMWDWRVHGAKVDGFTYGLNTASMKRFIDFAAANGIEYAMIDSGWYWTENEKHSDPATYIDDMDVPYLAKYAQDKGVGLWLYVDDPPLREYDLEKTLATYQQWGVVGVKHGFLNNQGQEGVRFSGEVMKLCAKYHLLYDAHEPVKPTGFRRTWPHYLAREFAHSLIDGPGNAPSTPAYMATLPFLNNLAGPIDRNPGMFELNTAKERDRVWGDITSTVAAQTAHCLTVFSGLLCLPDHGEAYTKKADLFEFIRELPMTWDETRVLNADIGVYVTIARRSGGAWFIGSLTNEEARTLDIPLDFIGEGAYTATLYADAPDANYLTNREAYQVETRTVTAQDTIHAWMAPGGGHSMWIRPAGG